MNVNRCLAAAGQDALLPPDLRFTDDSSGLFFVDFRASQAKRPWCACGWGWCISPVGNKKVPDFCRFCC